MNTIFNRLHTHSGGLLSVLLALLIASSAGAHDFGGGTGSPGPTSPLPQDNNPQPSTNPEFGTKPQQPGNTPPTRPDDPYKPVEDQNAGNNCDDPGKKGEPVSLYDGRLEYAKSDMIVNGLFPIEITRRYDSRTAYDSTLGYGWSFSHDRRLYEFADGSVIIRYACGSRDRFVYTGGAYVTPSSGRQGDLVENPDGSFVYTRQYGTREFYDAEGRLTAVQNKYGHRHEYTYDPAGKFPLTGTSPYSLDPASPMTVAYFYRVTRIDERAADGVLTGNYVTFAYDGSTGRLTSITSSDGRVVSYVHDTTSGLTKGNLTQVNGLEGIDTTYLYTDASDTHNLTSVQKQAGATPLVSTYDTQDRVIQQTHGNDTFTYDYVVDLTETRITHTIKDAAGANPYDVTSTYYFDSKGYVLTSSDAEGNEVRYQRDAQGSMVAKTFYKNTGSPAVPSLVLERTINFGYDPLGRKASTSVTLDSGETITTSVTWDNGWVASKETVSDQDPSRIFRTEYTFVRDGQYIPINIQSIRLRRDNGSFQVTSFAYDAKNRLTEAVLPDGQKIISLYENGSLYETRRYYEVASAESPYGRLIFGHDGQGNRNLVTDANGNSTQYTYDDVGRLVQVTNALGEEDHYSYTGINLTQVERGHTAVDGDGQITRMNYSPEGWLTSVDEKDDQGAWQRVETSTYDSAGQLLTSSDAQNRTVTRVYDALGRVASVTDPLNQTTISDYDMFNNRVSVLDAAGRLTTTSYDDMDRAVSVKQNGVSPVAETLFDYDALGNPVAVTDPAGHTMTYTVGTLSRVTGITLPMGQTVQKVYDDHDRVDYVINARGNKIVYNYDPWDTVSSIEYYSTASSPSPDRTVTFVYDNALNLTSVSDDSIQAGPLYTLTYDALNRADVKTVSYLPGGARTLNYDYDRYGNVSGSTLTDVVPLVHTYTYNKRNRLASAALPGNQNFSFNYYASGELQQTAYPNGVTADYTYAGDGRLQDITVTGTSGTIEQFAYTRDSVGNVDTRTDADGLHDYDYDGGNRLILAVYAASTGLTAQDFSYDPAGNREDPSNSSLYDYDDNNRIVQAPGLTYTFDDDGNLSSRSDGAVFTHDKQSRMVQYAKGATTASYQYDPMGHRISKTVNGVKTWYLWGDDVLLAEFDNAGVRYKRYAYLPDEYQALQMEDSSGIYNLHEDNLQMPRLVTGSAEQVMWRSYHEAFGQATVDEDVDGDSNAVVLNQRFPGQYYDAESGLYYNLHRYYDPTAGRYVESDPAGQLGGINLYAYVNSNPLGSTDPEGLEERRRGKAEGRDDYGLLNVSEHVTTTLLKKRHAEFMLETNFVNKGARVINAQHLRKLKGLHQGVGAALTGYNAVVSVVNFACDPSASTGTDLGISSLGVAGVVSANPVVGTMATGLGIGKTAGDWLFSTETVGVLLLKMWGFSEEVAREAVADTREQQRQRDCNCP